MIEAQELAGRLRDGGWRITRQRMAILSVLCRASAALTPQGILDEAHHECPDLGLATVYRTVGLLEDSGCLRRVHQTDGGEGLALCSALHGHHVLCTGCGRVAEFSACDLAQTIEGAGEETGFVISHHYLELLGLCRECAQNGEREAV